MPIVTWNVNSLRARLPRLRELLDKHAPDVVCLQETKSEPDDFPHAVTSREAPNHETHGRPKRPRG